MSINHEPIIVNFDETFDEFSSLKATLTIESGEVYSVTNFQFNHVTILYLFYSGTKPFSELLTNELPNPYVIIGDYTVTGAGYTE